MNECNGTTGAGVPPPSYMDLCEYGDVAGVGLMSIDENVSPPAYEISVSCQGIRTNEA